MLQVRNDALRADAFDVGDHKHGQCSATFVFSVEVGGTMPGISDSTLLKKMKQARRANQRQVLATVFFAHDVAGQVPQRVADDLEQVAQRKLRRRNNRVVATFAHRRGKAHRAKRHKAQHQKRRKDVRQVEVRVDERSALKKKACDGSSRPGIASPRRLD